MSQHLNPQEVYRSDWTGADEEWANAKDLCYVHNYAATTLAW